MLSQVEYLVFSGGGVRGYSYVGVLQELERTGLKVQALKGCGGTSIGALIATLVCVGYTVPELMHELLKVHARDKIGLSFTTLMTKFGLDNGAALSQYVETLVGAKTGSAHTTFAEVDKKLVIIGCDLNHNTELVFDVERTPDLSIAAACQMSMAVPGLFAPVQYKGVMVVDGGLKNNFPLQYFPEHTTLGVRVSWPQATKLSSIDQVLARTIYCILTDAESMQWNTFSQVQRDHTITVQIGDLSTIELYLTPEQKHSIIQQGVLAVRRFVNNMFDNSMYRHSHLLLFNALVNQAKA